MKKINILTCLLILSACGGGSGGGNAPVVSGGDVNPVVTPVTQGMRVSEDAIKSNSNITSMASEILVAKNGDAPNIVRSATATIDNIVYDSYHLDDVRFTTGPVNGELREDMYVTFGINENTGEITRIVYHEGDELYEVERKPGTDMFIENVIKYQMGSGKSMYISDSYDIKPTDKNKVRDDIARSLRTQEKYVQDFYLKMFDDLGDDWDNEEHWVKETHNTKYELNGKILNTKMRYSDFGYDTTVTVGDDDNDFSVITGGYDIKRVNLSKPEFADKTFNFSGMAIGSKSYSDNNKYISEKISTNNGAATLTFDKGHETLVMPFNDYYTVTVDKDGDNAVVKFDNYKGSDDNFKFAKESDIKTNSKDHVFVDIKYFGDNNNPSESIGTVFYEEHSGKYPGFSGAFGVTK